MSEFTFELHRGQMIQAVSATGTDRAWDEASRVREADARLALDAYSSPSVLLGNMASGSTARGRIFWSSAKRMIASIALRFFASP